MIEKNGKRNIFETKKEEIGKILNPRGVYRWSLWTPGVRKEGTGKKDGSGEGVVSNGCSWAGNFDKCL